jgi:alcohol dehydrogenase
MNQFQFQTVPNIISGLGSIQQLRDILTARPYQHLLLVTDAGMLKHQLHLPILEILEDISLTYSIYSEVEADPSEQIVLNAVDYAKQQKVDIVLGFGGGSSMDVAKIIAILSHPAQQQKLSDIFVMHISSISKSIRLELVIKVRACKSKHKNSLNLLIR